MRILWFTNILLPDHSNVLGLEPINVGGWMTALANAIKNIDGLQLAIATCTNIDKLTISNNDSIQYYAVPLKKYRGLTEDLIQNFQHIENDFKPDLIHIHGTELFYGLLTAKKILKTPAIVSIQGILDVVYKYYDGNLPYKDLIFSRTIRDWIFFDGIIERKIKMRNKAKIEQLIFKENKYFIGRTLWDYSHTMRLNPQAHYYHCDEILRSGFYHEKWDIEKIDRHTVFISSAAYPLKGFHVVLEALRLLKDEFHDIKIIVTLSKMYHDSIGFKKIWRYLISSNYDTYLTSYIKKHKLSKHILMHRTLNEEQMVSCYKKAHAFVLSSFIENSPNSLSEAQILGTPTIASYVGGVSSLATDENEALFFQQGDHSVLAQQIRRIFNDDDLALKLSKNSKNRALARHDKVGIANTMISIYKSILESKHEKNQ